MRFLVAKLKILARRGLSGQSGANLLECLVGAGLLGIVAAAFYPAINSGLMGSERVEGVYAAVDLARNQINDIKNESYSDINSYPVSMATSGEYDVAVTVIDESPPEFPNTLQKIVVTVSRGSKTLLVLEDYKAKIP